MGFFTSKIPAETDISSYLASPLLWQDFESRVANVSDSIRQILTSGDTASYLIELGIQYDLEDTKTTELARIIRDVLLWKNYLGDLPQLIQEHLAIDAPLAKTIANHLVGELFQPAITDIKALQVAHFSDRIGNNQQTPKNGTNVLDLKKQS